MTRESRNLITALDVGTSKIMAAIAEIVPEGGLKLLGLGTFQVDSKKPILSRGVVVNIEATVQGIQQALEEAEKNAECKIQHVCVGLSGDHIRGQESQGNQPIGAREVTELDVIRLMENAQAIHIPSDRRVLLLEPQEISMDGLKVPEPVGLKGTRLDVKAYMVTGLYSAAENIHNCVRRCGVEVERFIINAQASGRAVLTEDERKLGVVLLDIGAGNMDLAIFFGGVLRHTEVWPWAGNLITNDIAMGLHTPLKDAEELKINHGCAKELLAHPQEQVRVRAMSEHNLMSISLQTLARAIESRITKFLQTAEEAVMVAGYQNKLAAGVVLTGGTAVTPGIVDLASDILPWSVRCGMPRYPEGLADIPTMAQPSAATIMGLLEDARLARLRGFRMERENTWPNWMIRAWNFLKKHT